LGFCAPFLPDGVAVEEEEAEEVEEVEDSVEEEEEEEDAEDEEEEEEVVEEEEAELEAVVAGRGADSLTAGEAAAAEGSDAKKVEMD
jgi:hypothetical protein